jgi:hypothetical protein
MSPALTGERKRIREEKPVEQNKTYSQTELAVAIAENPNPTKLSDMADLLTAWRMVKEDSEARLSEANKKIREVEQVIIAKLQEEELEKFVHNGQLFYPYVSAHPGVNKEHEAEFYAWLRENGEDGIIKETVHPMTLKSWWKQNSERFAEELTGKELLKVHEEIRIGVRKQ